MNAMAILSAYLSACLACLGVLSVQPVMALSLTKPVVCEGCDRTDVNRTDVNRTDVNRTDIIIAANDIFSQGFRHQIRGKPDAALERLALALTMFQVIDEPEGEAHALTGMASIHRDLGNDEQALAYFKQAFAVQLDIRAYSPAMRSLTNIGVLYTRLHQLDDAIRVYQQAIQLAQKIGDRPHEAELRQRIHELDD